jgi:hypothetical protein
MASHECSLMTGSRRISRWSCSDFALETTSSFADCRLIPLISLSGVMQSFVGYSRQPIVRKLKTGIKEAPTP